MPLGKRGTRTHIGGVKLFVVALSLLLGAATLAACTTLKTFDAIVPKDGGTRLTLRNAAYGAHARQTLDVYAPREASAAPRPMLVFIHGGSWQNGDKNGYAFAGRAFAAQGFVTAVPNYRLVPEGRYPVFLQDSAAAVKWLRANAARLGGDPDRIVLVGHSAGAYNAAMLGLDERWLGPDKAAVKAFVGLAGPYDFLPLDGPILEPAFGRPANPAETQPVTHAGPGDPPSLLLHGGEDTTVRLQNSLNLAAKLRAAGVDGQAKIYPELGHIGIVAALSRPFRGTPVLRDAADFARLHTGLAQAPRRN